MQPEAFEVAVLSPSGWGNLGDAAIVDSVLHALAQRRKHARVALFTLNPEDSARRHGVQSFTCTGFSRPNYGISQVFWAARDSAATRLLDSARVSRFARLTRMPGMRRFISLGRLVRSERRHRLALSDLMGSLELVIVAGGGQIDDFWGGALGHPYVLARWAQAAKQRGARYLVLSVGTGVLQTPLARLFARRALARADYRSFRDARSRELAGVEAPVVPDLAYGFPIERFRRRALRSSRRLTVGVSPIAYCDPRVWPEADAQRYRSYMSRLSALMVRLVEAGHELRMFATDGPDNVNMRDLMEDLRARLGPEDFARVHAREVESLDQLFELFSTLDIAVVSRLHGGILAHLMGVPVVALSYERKVVAMMASMQHEQLCLNIDTFDVADALAVCTRALADREALTADVLDKVESYRKLVLEQYDRVLS